MGFKDQYTKKERVGGKYLSSRDLSKVSATFYVAAVVRQPDHVYNGEVKPRFLLTGVASTGAEGNLPIQMGSDTRDDTVIQIEKWLADGGDPVQIRFIVDGQFIDIEPV